MGTGHGQSDEAEAVSTQIGKRLPADVEPLNASVDPDALDDLFADRVTAGTVQFTHAGYRIVVCFAEGSWTVVVKNA